jgi:hypothetical protein
MEIMALKVTSTPYIIIPQLKSKIADIETCEGDVKFSRATWDREILYADRSRKDERILIRPILWDRRKAINQYERKGQFKVNIHILFNGQNS